MVAGPRWLYSPRRGPLEPHRKAATVKIRLQQIITSPSGLVMGVQIRGPKDSWVRFAVLEVPWAEVPRHFADDFYKWMDRDEVEVEYDAPLPLDWG